MTPAFRTRVQRVQRGRLTAPAAPKVLKVLKFDAACGCEDCGGGYAAIYSLRYVLPLCVTNAA